MKRISEYKALARQSMKGSYGQGLALFIGVTLAQALINGIFSRMAGNSQIMIFAYNILNLIIATIIFNPLLVGLNKFFLGQAQGKPDMNNLFYPFKTNLTNIVKIGFFRDIKLILWFVPSIVIASVMVAATSVTTTVATILPVATIVFMIPGIIKSLEYTVINYILAENPDIKSKDAFKMAKEMMTGYKRRLFLLELSFIGWIWLGILAFGVGIFFVVPYLEAAAAHFYLDVKEQAGYAAQTFGEEYDANKIDNGDTFGL